MRIIIDTNVVISAVFFGGYPRKVVEEVLNKGHTAYASKDIINEYNRVIDEMIKRKNGKIDMILLSTLISKLIIINPTSNVDICRDPFDNMFINCAIDSEALYIVSGDKDLLDLKQVGVTRVITAKEFCDRFIPSNKQQIA